MGRQVVLTTAAIESLVFNADMRREFPFVAAAYNRWMSTVSTKACCGRAKAQSNTKEYLANSVKDNLVSLSPERKNIFKKIIAADEVIVQTGEHRVTF